MHIFSDPVNEKKNDVYLMYIFGKDSIFWKLSPSLGVWEKLPLEEWNLFWLTAFQVHRLRSLWCLRRRHAENDGVWEEKEQLHSGPEAEGSGVHWPLIPRSVFMCKDTMIPLQVFYSNNLCQPDYFPRSYLELLYITI